MPKLLFPPLPRPPATLHLADFRIHMLAFAFGSATAVMAWSVSPSVRLGFFSRVYGPFSTRDAPRGLPSIWVRRATLRPVETPEPGQCPPRGRSCAAATWPASSFDAGALPVSWAASLAVRVICGRRVRAAVPCCTPCAVEPITSRTRGQGPQASEREAAQTGKPIRPLRRGLRALPPRRHEREA